MLLNLNKGIVQIQKYYSFGEYRLFPESLLVLKFCEPKIKLNYLMSV